MMLFCILCLTYVSAAAVLDDEPQESAEDAAQERLAWEQAHSVLPWELATDDDNPPAKLFRNFLKTEIENQKRGSCDFER